MDHLNAIDALIADLRGRGDYHQLFYALLLKARVALKVSPFPTGPAADLPAEVHEPYEAAIRAAAREVGGLLLKQNDLPRAWGFFRLIGEPGPIQEALERFEPGPDDDIYPLLDLAWHQRVSPARGFDLVLARNGVCSAITTLSSTDLSNDLPLRLACIGKLIAALHAQLLDRLEADLVHRKLTLPSPPTLPGMLRDELFLDDAYHIDVSHLSSVVQMALELPPGDAALGKARELCDYGRKLSRAYRGESEPPFENNYEDYAVLLGILAGDEVEHGLSHYEAKIAPALVQGNSFPAEVLVNLLLKLDRLPQALTVAKTHLPAIDDAELSCPGVMDLARRAGDYASLKEAALAKGDAVTALAAEIALNSM